MADGQLRCCGSSLFLKTHFGVGYNLTLVKEVSDKAVSSATVHEVIKRHVPKAITLSDVGAEMSF
ncbi:unnamed protein product, partial [Chrysoparadoxa australica]